MALYSVDKAQLNSINGSFAHDVDRLLLRIQQHKAWFDTVPDADLVDIYGYTQGDVNIMRSAINDLDQLRTIYQGAGTLTAVKDFRTFAKLLYPFGSLT